MPGGIEHFEDIQPNIYCAPEVIMEVPWTYSVDIWNVGCMVRQKTGDYRFKCTETLRYLADLEHFGGRVLTHWL
jgi:hypothetical protein